MSDEALAKLALAMIATGSVLLVIALVMMRLALQ